MSDWLNALRNGRQPSAPVQVGYAHSVACIMGHSRLVGGQEALLGPENGIDPQPSSSGFGLWPSGLYRYLTLSRSTSFVATRRLVKAIPA